MGDSFREIAKRGREIEKELGINFDDVLNKLTQEVGEFNDAVQKYRGRFCRNRTEDLEDVRDELGDVLFNLSSVANRLGINPDEFSSLAGDTLKKFEDRMKEGSYRSKNVRVTLCGSIAFFDEMVEVKKKLEKRGFVVKMPPNELKGENGEIITAKKYYELRKSSGEKAAWIWERKAEAIDWHYQKVDWADIILVLNYDKRGIENYIGANTLMEMGLAFFLKKVIYLLNKVPEIGSREEILGMKPIILNGDLSRIK